MYLASSSAGVQIAGLLDSIASNLAHKEHVNKARWFQQRTVDIARELCRRDPRKHCDKLALYLHRLGLLHERLQHTEFALKLYREAVMFWRSLYTKKNPWLLLAFQRCRKSLSSVIRVSLSVVRGRQSLAHGLEV